MKVHIAGYVSNRLKEDQPATWTNCKAGTAEDQTREEKISKVQVDHKPGPVWMASEDLVPQGDRASSGTKMLWRRGPLFWKKGSPQPSLLGESQPHPPQPHHSWEEATAPWWSPRAP